MKKTLEITITADGNDADYQTEVTAISEEDLEKIKPLIKAIKAFKPYKTTHNSYTRENHHNYPYGECLRDDLGEKSPQELYDFSEEVFEIFESLLPANEYGLHTINSIYITPLIKKTKLL